MKKLKKIWQENSVLLVLLMILLACLIAISIVVVTYFVGDSSTKYGERLDEIDKHPFSEKDQKELITKLENEKAINKVSIRISGKTIYVNIKFLEGITLVEAESKATKSLEYFSEDILSFYDIEFLISADDSKDQEGFKIIGSRNVSGTGGIVWNNNTIMDDEEK